MSEKLLKKYLIGNLTLIHYKGNKIIDELSERKK